MGSLDTIRPKAEAAHQAEQQYDGLGHGLIAGRPAAHGALVHVEEAPSVLLVEAELLERSAELVGGHDLLADDGDGLTARLAALDVGVPFGDVLAVADVGFVAAINAGDVDAEAGFVAAGDSGLDDVEAVHLSVSCGHERPSVKSDVADILSKINGAP